MKYGVFKLVATKKERRQRGVPRLHGYGE